MAVQTSILEKGPQHELNQKPMGSVRYNPFNAGLFLMLRERTSPSSFTCNRLARYGVHTKQQELPRREPQSTTISKHRQNNQPTNNNQNKHNQSTTWKDSVLRSQPLARLVKWKLRGREHPRRFATIADSLPFSFQLSKGFCFCGYLHQEH